MERWEHRVGVVNQEVVEEGLQRGKITEQLNKLRTAEFNRQRVMSDIALGKASASDLAAYSIGPKPAAATGLLFKANAPNITVKRLHEHSGNHMQSSLHKHHHHASEPHRYHHHHMLLKRPTA
eukprot:TRINITY_DN47569_c0_g1_i1.p1 TRINITY_DN47569_c0_g1~~TRINITY_DN47569_c0_g1_i1.p1  ORF type:complete len:130 (+),score=0.71 TRINITY_DN47569_c0_g1_i1:23-391(+)